MPLTIYLVLQMPCAQEVGLFRYSVGWPLLSRVRDCDRSGARSLRACEADAKRALDTLYAEVRVVNKSTAASLAEGLEETLTLHRLNVFVELSMSFRTTNLIESVMARIEARIRRVTCWRTSDQKLR